MNHLIYEPEYQTAGRRTPVRVFAYVQPDRKIVVRWEFYNTKWHYLDDQVCEDISHFIAVWELRWDA